MYGKGISREGSLIDIGVDMDIVSKSGAWYTYDGEQLGQGKENAKTFLSENPEIMMDIENRIWAEVKPPEDEVDLTEEEGDDEFSELDDEPIAIEE